MNEINQRISPAEANAALASIGEANTITVFSLKPPIWLIFLFSVALGVKTTAMGLMYTTVPWQVVQWISYITLCAGFITWVIIIREKGIGIGWNSNQNVTKKVVILAVSMCLMLILSRIAFLQTGNEGLSYAAGIINGLLLAYTLKFNSPLEAKSKVKNNA